MGISSGWHWLVILIVVVLIFGTKKLRNVGKDLGGAGRDLQQADGALDVGGGQGRASAGDVDELGQQEDDEIDSGLLTGDDDGVAAHVDIDVGEPPLDGAQDLVVHTEQVHRSQVRGQDEAAGDVLGSAPTQISGSISVGRCRGERLGHRADQPTGVRRLAPGPPP